MAPVAADMAPRRDSESVEDGSTTNYASLDALEKGHDADDFKNEDFSTAAATKERGEVAEEKSRVSTSVVEEKGPKTVTAAAPGGSGPQDPNVVDWDGPDDPANPMNWSSRRKAAAITIISINTTLTPLASSMVAPGIPLLLREFDSTNGALASFVVSVYILGYAAGPFLVAPLSEVYGRSICYNVSNVIFMAFTLGCALSTDLAMFTVFRFFQGVAGVTPLTIGGGSIADMIPMEKRGGAMAAWVMGPMLGPVLGPIIGGFLSQAEGWRWTFWLLLILSGVVSILSFLLGPETFAPVLLLRKTKRLQKETGNMQLRSKMDQGLSPRDFLKRAMIRPSKILFQSPIVAMMSLDVAIMFSYMFLLFTTFTFVFEQQYNFNTGEAGLIYIGLGVGLIVGLVVIGKTSDKIMMKKKAQNQMKPEWRLPLMIPATFLVPIGLFWYGWTAEYKVHWIVPILGTVPIGMGMVGTFMPVQMYFVDVFKMYAASATAVATVMRSLFGALIPLAGQALYARLGLGWGNSLLAFLALALAPVPILLFTQGERIRTHPRFQVKL